jgi:Class III cytochrome C family
MSLKLACIAACAMAVAIPAALSALPFALQGSQAPPGAVTIELDKMGRRGSVLFDHKAHETRVNPDPNYPYKAKAAATCAGCHHTTNRLGVLQLWKCSSCHLDDGDPRNPKNREFDEVRAERAFHDQCIGCHRASNKGPITCAECHRSVASSPISR